MVVKSKRWRCRFDCLFPIFIVQPPRVGATRAHHSRNNKSHVMTLSFFRPCGFLASNARHAFARTLHTAMALRRFAQENSAAASPRSPKEYLPGSPGNPPSTPKPRLSYGIHRSPADTPSISSSVPFDWEAARSRAPPPYATPIRGRKSVGTGTQATPRKAIVRKKSMFEK